MTRFVSLSAAMAAFVLAPAAMAKDPMEEEIVEVEVDVEELEPGKARLISFNGEKEFLKASTRLRIWRADVGYTLTVGADGTVTECQLLEKFRRAYVKKRLCQVLVDHHEFEPALDEAEQPVESHYTSRLVYLDMRAKEK
ncbi:MAG: hypothetical protein AAGK01_06110 [Pseudomonadota bacterium]